MAGKITCACGKQYAWKPELAGKRAKCKCGAVVKIPAEDPGLSAAPPTPPPPPPPPPPVPDVPEGFEGGYDVADDVPPPPPPASTPTYRAPSSKVASGFTDSTAAAGAGGGGMKFTFNWRAALTALGGLAVLAFGVFEFMDITHKEQAGQGVVFHGRRSGWLTILYGIGGRWGVLGLFVVAGLSMVVGAVLVMLGKKAPKEE